mgnify:FL=1
MAAFLPVKTVSALVNRWQIDYNIKYEKSKPSPTPKEATMKKALKIAGCILLGLVILVLGYVADVC